jgi:hypothetical protein
MATSKITISHEAAQAIRRVAVESGDVAGRPVTLDQAVRILADAWQADTRLSKRVAVEAVMQRAGS